jgi:hypothetical protein
MNQDDKIESSPGVFIGIYDWWFTYNTNADIITWKNKDHTNTLIEAPNGLGVNITTMGGTMHIPHVNSELMPYVFVVDEEERFMFCLSIAEDDPPVITPVDVEVKP